MPEGPEIRRAADTLEQAVAQRPLTQVYFSFAELKPYEGMLLGKQIDRIETRGKAMLTHFSNGLTLYSHNQLYGIWRVVKGQEQPESHRILRVRLGTAENSILLYSASDIEMLESSALESHPFLRRIGPDVLDPTLSVDTVLARLSSKAFCRRQLGSLLLDQRFLAGLGNYLRAEILWEAGLKAEHRAEELTADQLTELAQAILAIPRLSYRTRGEPSAGSRYDTTFRFRVYHRAGEPCERCFTIIEKKTQSSRPLYWCPFCQR